MDETKKDKCSCDMCACGMGHMHGHFGFWVAKVLVALVVLLFVFWLGVKVGEVKSFMGMGRMGGGMNMMYYRVGSGSMVSPAHPIMPVGGMMDVSTSTSAQ